MYVLMMRMRKRRRRSEVPMVMRVENVFEWMVLTKRVVGIRPNHSLNIMSSMMMMMMMMVMMVMEIIVMTFKSVGDLVTLHQIVSAGQILRAGRWVTFHLYSILGGVAQNPATCFGNSPKGWKWVEMFPQIFASLGSITLEAISYLRCRLRM